MRIVVKIGTNLLTQRDGSVNKKRVSALVADIKDVMSEGNKVILVTSGAIGAGMGKMKVSKRPEVLKEKQALAAIGQPLLMAMYHEAFGQAKINVAQVLLTRHDFDDRARYLNARNTILTLLDWNIVPIVNENDTIAVEEINFGENDTLSALVASKISADLLVILTDVDGLYKGAVGKSELITKVDKITKEVEGYASGVSSSGKGTGGMSTKISAAKIATLSGVKVLITNGANADVLKNAISNNPKGTVFSAKNPLEARKCWIAFGTKCKGKIVVDDGAAKALNSNKSLLPSGIVSVEGSFAMGDTVSILSANGTEIGRGLTSYSSSDVNSIKGKKTTEIKKLLANADYEDVIHKDNLVIL